MIGAVPLHLIPGTPAPDTPAEAVRKRLRATKPPDMLQCPRCAGREVLVTITGAVYQAGKVKGGTKSWVCAGCHRKGERVVLI